MESRALYKGAKNCCRFQLNTVSLPNRHMLMLMLMGRNPVPGGGYLRAHFSTFGISTLAPSVKRETAHSSVATIQLLVVMVMSLWPNCHRVCLVTNTVFFSSVILTL